MTSKRLSFIAFLKEEEAPTMVEYGLLVLVIALVALVGVRAVGLAVKGLFDQGTAPF